MDVLFLAHRPPYPPDKGDKIRSCNIIRHLAERGARVHLLALADNPAELEHKSALESLCESVNIFPQGNMSRKIRACLAPLRGRPMSAGYFYNPPLRRRFEDLLGRIRPCAIFCFCSPMAEYILNSPALRTLSGSVRPRLLMDLVDVDSEKWREYSNNRNNPLRLIHALEGRILGAYEKRLCEFFDDIFLVSEAEADLLRRRVSDPSIISGMSNGVDLEWFRPTDALPIPGKMAFCGSMNYPPNIDAARWFATSVFPLVKKRVPEASFVVIGRGVGPEIRELEAIDGVEVTGDVADVRPHVWSASLSTAPLRIARGLQNKVLEAMAMGLPVLCTPEAREGLTARPGLDVAEERAEPVAFAEAAANLLLDQKAAQRMGRKARQTVERDYRWDACLAPLDRCLDLRRKEVSQ